MLTDKSDLIVTSPPYGCQVADVAAENLLSGRAMRREDTSNYSPDRSNLGHARGSTYLAAMSEVYEACVSVLKPGGFMVLVTKDMRWAVRCTTSAATPSRSAKASVCGTGSASSVYSPRSVTASL